MRQQYEVQLVVDELVVVLASPVERWTWARAKDRCH